MADAETCDVLWALLRQASDRAWALVLGVRHPAQNMGDPARKLLGELRRNPATVEMQLDPLDRQSTGALVAALLGDGLPAAGFVDGIFRRTEGNPYYVE